MHLSGQYNGSATLIQQKHLIALLVYSPRYSHVLNLAVVIFCNLIWHKIYLPQLVRYFISLITLPRASMCWMEFVMTRASSSHYAKLDGFKKLMLWTFVELFDSIVKAFNGVTSNPSKWSRDFLGYAMSLTQANATFWVYSNSPLCGTVHIIHWNSDVRNPHGSNPMCDLWTVIDSPLCAV